MEAEPESRILVLIPPANDEYDALVVHGAEEEGASSNSRRRVGAARAGTWGSAAPCPRTAAGF